MPSMIRYLSYWYFVEHYSSFMIILCLQTFLNTDRLAFTAVLSWWLSPTYSGSFRQCSWPGRKTIYVMLLWNSHQRDFYCSVIIAWVAFVHFNLSFLKTIVFIEKEWKKTKTYQKIRPTKLSKIGLLTKKTFEIKAQRKTRNLTKGQRSLGSLSTPLRTLLLFFPKRSHKKAPTFANHIL